MLRTRLSDSLKVALKAKEARKVSTLRLILAALKDRDIAARTKGESEVIGDEEILQMLQTMVRQRHESIAFYKQGGREELAEQEAEEIAVIESFLPEQMSDKEIAEAVEATVAETGATGLKDMGRTMAALKASYAGRMDFAKASKIVKEKLS
jgi:uncharacterized protein YqeY